MDHCKEEEELQFKMAKRFMHEYHSARLEAHQLAALFREMCWYNFETNCKKWDRPWYQSDETSRITMHGHSYVKKWKKGRLRECATFPVYYDGKLSDAPPLPPEIILKELWDANAYQEWAYEQQFAPYDWAPGGRLYEKHMRESIGANTYHKWQSSKSV